MFSIRFLVFSLVLVLFSCTKSNIQVYNPYFLDMDIKIDDINYKLKDQSGIFISLKPGKHHIYSFMKKKLIDTIIDVSTEFSEKGGYLNLAKQPVYIWSQVYVDPSLQKSFEIVQSKTNDTLIDSPAEMVYNNQKFNIIKVDDVNIFGPVVEISKNELMVTNRWKFFIDQDFSENVEVDHYGTGGIFKKLFSKDELLKYWSNYNSP